MLGLAKRVGARFLLTSTSEVYGDPLQHPQAESYWGNVNPIGQSLSIFLRFALTVTLKAMHEEKNIIYSFFFLLLLMIISPLKLSG